MPIIAPGDTNYTTLEILKASLGVTDALDDTALRNAIAAASRAIDDYTGTTFYPVTEARVFDPDNNRQVWVDRFRTATGLTVKTGTDGTYTTTVTAVVKWPYQLKTDSDAYQLLISPTSQFPCPAYRGYPTVQVTATWGWATVPDAVEEACRIKAARLYRRKDTPEGIAGGDQFGAVRISKYEDPDVVQSLAPYLLQRFA